MYEDRTKSPRSGYSRVPNGTFDQKMELLVATCIVSWIMTVNLFALPTFLDHKKSIVGIGVCSLTRSQWDFGIRSAIECASGNVSEDWSLLFVSLFDTDWTNSVGLTDDAAERGSADCYQVLSCRRPHPNPDLESPPECVW